jgi:hypothetical protein
VKKRERQATDGPGLRQRMQRAARSISEQHHQLDTLYADLSDALDRRDDHQARLVFLRFSDALNAHFSLEETLFFPALNGLHPPAAAEVAALALEHRRFDAALAEISEKLRSEALAGAGEQLDQLATALGAHERREESLLRSVLNRKEN